MHTVQTFEPSFINIQNNKYIKYSFNLSNVSRIKVGVDDNGVFSVYARCFNGKPLPRKLLCFEFDLPSYLIEHHLLHMINTMHSYGVFTIWYPVFTEQILNYSRPIPPVTASTLPEAEKAEDEKSSEKAEEKTLEKEEKSSPKSRKNTPSPQNSKSSIASSGDEVKSNTTVSTTPSRKPLSSTECSSSSNVSDISVESH